MAATATTRPVLNRATRARLLRDAAPVLDRLLQPLTWLAARQMRLLRALTPPGAPRSFSTLDRAGIYPLIDHYYDPLINLGRLSRPLSAPRRIAGLDLRMDDARRLLHAMDGLDAPGQPAGPSDGPAYNPANTMFCPVDAGVLFCMVMRHRPKRILEIGCGMSTLAFRLALDALLAADPAYRCEHTCIEPFEAPWLERLPVQVLRVPAEAAPLDLVRSLGAGDILFIDSSHIIRPQGDVVTTVLEWLGLLGPGVVVHIHDIYTPYDYPDDLLRRHRFLWNEQYLVEAFLCFNRAFEILAPVHALWRDPASGLAQLCPAQAAWGQTVPSSLWLRRVD